MITRTDRRPGNILTETGQAGRKRFQETVRVGLDFWREKTADIDEQAIELLDAERHNLHRAVQFGLVVPEAWDLTAQVSVQAIPLVNRRMYWSEWIPVLEGLVQQAPAWGMQQKFSLLIQLGRCQRMLRKLEEATESHEAAAVVAKEQADDLALAEAFYNIGRDYFTRRMYGPADENSHAALILLDDENPTHRSLITKSHDTLGINAMQMGDLVRAEAHHRRAVDEARKIGDTTLIIRMLNSLARTLQNDGRYDEAVGFYLEAEQLLAPSSNHLDKTLTRLNLGTAYFSQGNWKAAEASFRKADSEHLRRSSNFDYRARVLTSLGNVMLKQERWIEAEIYLEMAIKLWKELGDDLSLANAVGTLGEVLAGRGKIAEAIPLIEQALMLLDRYPDHAWASKLRGIFEKERDRIKLEN
jgi:tetratricopeptide (TPR) repeat protein